MRSALRCATVAILLAIFLAPGLVQARTLARSGKWLGASAPEPSFFSMVWNLLTAIWEKDGDNGGQLDPSGSPGSGTGGGGTTNNSEAGGGGGENGGQLDPSGG